MGRKDIATTNYMKQNKIFADAFNFLLYDGKQVLQPQLLEELDTKETAVPYGGHAGTEQPVQRIRDVVKSAVVMTDQRTAYMVLAIEGQSDVHYVMPVKNLLYDALQYCKQIQLAVESHKKSDDRKQMTGVSICCMAASLLSRERFP